LVKYIGKYASNVFRTLDVIHIGVMINGLRRMSMDPMEKLKYSIIIFNLMAFCFGAIFGINLERRGKDNDKEDN